LTLSARLLGREKIVPGFIQFQDGSISSVRHLETLQLSRSLFRIKQRQDRDNDVTMKTLMAAYKLMDKSR